MCNLSSFLAAGPDGEEVADPGGPRRLPVTGQDGVGKPAARLFKGKIASYFQYHHTMAQWLRHSACTRETVGSIPGDITFVSVVG